MAEPTEQTTEQVTETPTEDAGDSLGDFDFDLNLFEDEDDEGILSEAQETTGTEEEVSEPTGEEPPAEEQEAPPPADAAPAAASESEMEAPAQQEEAPAAETQPPAEVEAVPDLDSYIAENRDRLLDSMAETFAGSAIEEITNVPEGTEVSAAGLAANLSTGLPRALARVQLETVQGMVALMRSAIPQMVNSAIESRTANETFEEKFYSRWEGLDDDKYTDTIVKIGQAVKAGDPNMEEAEFIKQVGTIASMRFGLPVDGAGAPAKANGKAKAQSKTGTRVVKRQAFAPAATGESSTTGTPPSANWIEDLDQMITSDEEV